MTDRRRFWIAPARVAAGLALAALAGCVERTMKIQTEPAGALATVNDEEVGLTPAKMSFTWYGDYDLVFRKEGYETLHTHHRIHPPWFQWIGLDFFTELVWPGTFLDVQTLPTFALAPASQPAVKDVVDRAIELRDRATFEAP